MIAGQRPTPAAFMRRGPRQDTGELRDVAGLSVTLANLRTEQQVVNNEQNNWKNLRGICVIAVTDVMDVSPTLDIIPDKPTHANIKGLPEVPEDPPTTDAGKEAYKKAEFFGRELASRARMCWVKL
ncbi:hypothetical protein [Armatimonas sp.]|uniref:hypothetical protein n=1 Tax=Armatimonas sp. TaxID=1872638 RepID=UPI0037538D8D